MTHELKTTATLTLRFQDEHEMRQYVQRKTDSKPIDVHMACLYLSEWTDQAHTGYFFYPCGTHEIEVKFRPELPYKFLIV